MGIKELIKDAHMKAAKREIKLLVSACELGEDMTEALIVPPLSDLDTRDRDGWMRPNGLYYEDYIITDDTNEISLLREGEGNVLSSHETTVDDQIELDKEYRDWQTPSGTLYEQLINQERVS
jgi:hypothetical protein